MAPARKRAVAYFRPLSHLRYAVARPLWRDGSPSPWRASSGLPGRGCGVIKAWLPSSGWSFADALLYGVAYTRACTCTPYLVPSATNTLAGARMGPRMLSTDGSGCTQNARLVTRWYRYPAHSLAPIARLFVVYRPMDVQRDPDQQKEAKTSPSGPLLRLCIPPTFSLPVSGLDLVLFFLFNLVPVNLL